MSDYSVKITVSNARIRNAMKNAGFANVAQMCRHGNLKQQEVGKILNLKLSPRLSSGHWRKVVTDMADVLGVFPDDLFSERQATMKLKYNCSTREVTESELLKIACDEINRDRLEFLSDNAAIQEIMEEEKEEIVSKAIDTLPPGYAKRLRSLFVNGKSRSDVAKEQDISLGRVQQIVDNGARRLRSDKSEFLNDLKDVAGVE